MATPARKENLERSYAYRQGLKLARQGSFEAAISYLEKALKRTAQYAYARYEIRTTRYAISCLSRWKCYNYSTIIPGPNRE